MTCKKIIIFFVFLSVLTVSGYYGFKFFSRSFYPDKAYHCLVNGDLLAASESLQNLPSHRLSSPLPLYLGYLELAQEHFDQASYYFNQLLPLPLEDPSVLVQSQLALALCAYQMQQEEQFLELFQKAKQTPFSHPAMPFFEALNYYLQGYYSEATTSWTTYISLQNSSQCDWLIAILNRFYPSCWVQVHLAHCLIEQGDIKIARQLLEKEQHLIDNPEHPTQQLASLFLGLCYLKEANSFPLAERTSYYQLAHFYFRKTAQLNPYADEKQRVIRHLNQELSGLLGSSLSIFNQSWCLALLHLLQDWQETSILNNLADMLAQQIVFESPKDQQKLLTTLREEFQGSLFYHTFCDSLVINIEQAVYRDCLPSFCTLWNTISEFHSLSEAQIHHLAEKVYEHMLKTIYWDETDLSNTQHLADIYLTLLPHNNDLLAFALIQQAFQLWRHIGQEEKSIYLMDFVLTFSHHRHELEQQIEIFLKDLFVKAEANNLLPRLVFIHEALSHFQINMNQAAFMNHEKIANHLADAAYLYKARNYLASQTHAAWVLKLDPDNVCAQRLMGLSSFQLGQHQQAIEFLRQLPYPDLYVQQALAFAHAYAKEKQKEHIAQKNDLENLNEGE
ncbi:MAG: DUF1347 family protein [Verrucomicrobia bacterium]|nr:DUF1347 family protein [Verrucomicrobiota bacterium]MBS0647111.1 DUF1347 family protein [Verrucomicrobiota bacterium]